MKAITILQPYASLIVVGAKKYETRSWDTSYRGKIAIHTGKNIPFERGTEFFTKAKGYLNGTDINELPKGAIIAVADLVECYEVVDVNGERWSESKIALNPDGTVRRDERGHRIGLREKEYPTGDELIFGNLDVGMWAWEFANITPLPKPLTYRGNQRLWDVPDELIALAMKGGDTQ